MTTGNEVAGEFATGQLSGQIFDAYHETAIFCPFQLVRFPNFSEMHNAWFPAQCGLGGQNDQTVFIAFRRTY